MGNVPDGAVRYGRRRQAARIAGLAAYCAALAIALGVVAVAVFLSQINREFQYTLQHPPSPGIPTPIASGWVIFSAARPTPGVNFLPAQIAGIGSLLALIAAITCGAVAVSKLRRSSAPTG